MVTPVVKIKKKFAKSLSTVEKKKERRKKRKNSLAYQILLISISA